MRLIQLAWVVGLLAAAAPASAAPLLVLDGHRVRAEDGRFLPPPDPAAPAVAPSTPARAAAAGPSVWAELRRLRDEGAIDSEEYAAHVASYQDALQTYNRLRGTRHQELGAVLVTLRQVAARSELTASRLAPLFEILDRNRQWWANGSLLSAGQRVRFAGSLLIFEYFRGQGIQLHPLANFGRANGYWKGGYDKSLAKLIAELVPLAAQRGGGPAWEYYFSFRGGRPPWVSGLAQGTAIEALTRAAARLGDPSLLDLARRALGIFELAPPLGVRVVTPIGAHYLIYSFAPSYRVINGFIQALNGLNELAATGDPRAQGLFAAGDAEARVELPGYDTGAWSMYDQSTESSLSYHVLLRDFLDDLCRRSAVPIYCDKAARFTAYLSQPPTVQLLTRRARSGRYDLLRFRVSKISRVGAIVQRGARRLLATSATVGRGARAYRWLVPREPGAYRVRLVATDLAGNRTAVSGTLRVLSPRRSS